MSPAIATPPISAATGSSGSGRLPVTTTPAPSEASRRGRRRPDARSAPTDERHFAVEPHRVKDAQLRVATSPTLVDLAQHPTSTAPQHPSPRSRSGARRSSGLGGSSSACRIMSGNLMGRARAPGRWSVGRLFQDARYRARAKPPGLMPLPTTSPLVPAATILPSVWIATALAHASPLNVVFTLPWSPKDGSRLPSLK